MFVSIFDMDNGKIFFECQEAMKKIQQKFTWKCKFNFMKLKSIIKNGLVGAFRGLMLIIAKLQLPIIIFVALIAIGLIALFMIYPQWANIGETRIETFGNKIALMGVLLTAVSLISAAVTIFIALQKPKLKIFFYNDHGSSLDWKKGEIELGMDKAGKVGYQGCVPTKWNINLVNIGRKTAEKIKIKVSFDNIYFDMSLAEEGYDLEEFQYGFGIFQVISFEVTDLLRQDEQFVLPDLPFRSTECDADVLREKGYTRLRILIYSGNHEPIVLRYKVMIRDYDLDSFGYAENSNISLNNWEYRNHFYNWYINNHKDAEEQKDLYYYFTERLDPYQIEKYPYIEESRQLYQYYQSRDVEKMLFWGRIYYRALGMLVHEVEAVLQTEMLKVSASGIKKKQGTMSII